ncbi:glycosyltransferase family 10 domain-containing protein [Simiduia agarivorans]|uniref:glycosyltransferase family 10 domain-containing protein n=1 Tax=Simiduia agarivorans TaxID=447471 RepID=UPI00028B09BB|nr:glycosyltransferase family 10 [Simiduia agarivorans]
MLGSDSDIIKNPREIENALDVNPNLKLLVISEEPYWDLVNSVSGSDKTTTIYNFRVNKINHSTSNLFKFKKLPYFITTEDHYFTRFSILFGALAKLKANELKNLWRNAEYRYAFMAEKRSDSRYDISNRQLESVGLMYYRTKIMSAFSEGNNLVKGKGWANLERRQSLPDWHLDKLARLDRRCFVISGLENTHHKYYVSEKIFDAFSCGAVPVYYASDEHLVWNIVPDRDSVINVYGLSPADAERKIKSFCITASVLEAYQQSIHSMCEIFSCPENLIRERCEFVEKLVVEIMDQLN